MRNHPAAAREPQMQSEATPNTVEQARQLVLAYRKSRNSFNAGLVSGWVLSLGLIFGLHRYLPEVFTVGIVGFMVAMMMVWVGWGAWARERSLERWALTWAGPWCPSGRFRVKEVLAELDKAHPLPAGVVLPSLPRRGR